MLAIFKRLSWFEWFWVVAAIVGFLTCYNAITTMLHENRELTTANSTLQQEKTEVTHALQEEQRSTVITDDVVFEYTFERELKIRDTDLIRQSNLTAYYTARDLTVQPQPAEVGHALPANPKPQPKATAMVAPDTRPSPAAIDVLARGMLDTYCRVYRNPDACTTENLTDGVSAKPSSVQGTNP